MKYKMLTFLEDLIMKNYRFILALVCTVAVLLSAGQTAFAAAPANDNCANATPISNVTNQAFTTVGATHDGLNSNGVDIWYVYTAISTGTVTVSLCGTTWDTELAVYSGSQCPATSGRQIAYNDDACNLASQVTFNATCGNQYLIEVGHFNANDYGNGVISISSSGTPCTQTNDNCANATAVGNVTNLTFNTTGATFDGPEACNQYNSPNLWYVYTATCTGTATISLCGSSFDTLLAAYSGTSCANLTLIGCNDDFCGQQSQLTINVVAGKSYWIGVSGYQAADTGQGKLTITCNGQTQEASDLGDAPDSTNHTPSIMRTYDSLVTAQFPTVYQGNAIKGPIHLQPKAKFYLGNTVTYEDEADQGYDQDGVNNLIPSQLNGNANRDGGDDGVAFPMAMNHCKLTAFDYVVNVIDPNAEMWVNVWVDWNRDGDWSDSGKTDINLNCSSCNTGGIVNEWAVQNQLLYNLNSGLNTVTTPGFLAWNPATGDKKVWMRITISDQPWKGGTGAAGSGPANGYNYGETEDYYFAPNENCAVCEDLNRDGTVDQNDLFTYMLNWLNSCSN
jgi:hypothetical protein